jgi:glycosyltransferase involved in cell wall biosynthesis
MKTVAPISAVIATRNRAESLSRTLESLLLQELLPAEFIVVDASDDGATRKLLAEFEKRAEPDVSVRWFAANISGAASQRNEGVACATQPFIWFFDDDILFEPNCVERLWKAISLDCQLGGVNAMIVNQRYQSPGLVSRTMFTLMHGRRERSFAGRVIGPAINLLPEDRDDLPEVIAVEWLNTTCTIYRHEALPNPPFPVEFTGYSLMEDVALSLEVGKKWKLANARTARIFHESQPGAHKLEARSVARMEVVNRYHVMTEVLGQHSALDFLRLWIWQFFQIASVAARSSTRAKAWPVFRGTLDGLRSIVSRSK